MLISVLILNLLLVLLCWWAIWQIWRVRQALAQVAALLNWVESQAEQLQELSPITMPQRIAALHHQYRQILLSLRQGRQLLSLLGFIRIWSQDRNHRQVSQTQTQMARKA